MKTFTRCPHCQTTNSIRYGLLGKPTTCEKCHRIFVPTELEMEERAAAKRALDKTIPFNLEADTCVVKNLDMDMIRITPGVFSMGSTGGFINEQPVHQVTLTQPFYIATSLVTQSQYQKIMEDSPSYFEGENHPVETISWTQAMEYCRRLTERETVAKRLPEKAYFRLPTEAEWEYAAARQDKSSAASQGDTALVTKSKDTTCPLTDIAWFQENSDNNTHPVKTKKPNVLGLYDMLGNVSEWCLDDYGAYSSEKVEDPINETHSGQKIRRGGSWASVATRCGSSERVGVSPDCRCALIGFRVVLSQSGKCPYDQDFLLV